MNFYQVDRQMDRKQRIGAQSAKCTGGLKKPFIRPVQSTAFKFSLSLFFIYSSAPTHFTFSGLEALELMTSGEI